MIDEIVFARGLLGVVEWFQLEHEFTGIRKGDL